MGPDFFSSMYSVVRALLRLASCVCGAGISTLVRLRDGKGGFFWFYDFLVMHRGGGLIGGSTSSSFPVSGVAGCGIGFLWIFVCGRRFLVALGEKIGEFFGVILDSKARLSATCDVCGWS